MILPLLQVRPVKGEGLVASETARQQHCQECQVTFPFQCRRVG